MNNQKFKKNRGSWFYNAEYKTLVCIIIFLLTFFTDVMLFSFCKAGTAEKNVSEYIKPDFLKDINDTLEVLAAVGKKLAADQTLIDSHLEKRLNSLLNGPESLVFTAGKCVFNEKENEIVYPDISIKLKNALFDSLNVETASIDIKHISFDAVALFSNGRLRVKSQNEITAEIKVAERDLNDYLKVKAEKIKVRRPYVKFDKGRLLIGGNVKYGIFVVKFDAAGVFKITGDSQINFDIKKLDVNRMRMPSNFVRKIISKINPIMDLDKFPFKLVMKKIEVSDGYLIFSSK